MNDLEALSRGFSVIPPFWGGCTEKSTKLPGLWAASRVAKGALFWPQTSARGDIPGTPALDGATDIKLGYTRGNRS